VRHIEAARAIAVCEACPVSAECLELSLRHWSVGQHGVWSGLVTAERVALRSRWLIRVHSTDPALPGPEWARSGPALPDGLMTYGIRSAPPDFYCSG
jgi:hypothetical protein